MANVQYAAPELQFLRVVPGGHPFHANPDVISSSANVSALFLGFDHAYVPLAQSFDQLRKDPVGDAYRKYLQLFGEVCTRLGNRNNTRMGRTVRVNGKTYPRIVTAILAISNSQDVPVGLLLLAYWHFDDAKNDEDLKDKEDDAAKFKEISKRNAERNPDAILETIFSDVISLSFSFYLF